jgi:hypothetical protein
MLSSAVGRKRGTTLKDNWRKIAITIIYLFTATIFG